MHTRDVPIPLVLCLWPASLGAHPRGTVKLFRAFLGLADALARAGWGSDRQNGGGGAIGLFRFQGEKA